VKVGDLGNCMSLEQSDFASPDSSSDVGRIQEIPYATCCL